LADRRKGQSKTRFIYRPSGQTDAEGANMQENSGQFTSAAVSDAERMQAIQAVIEEIRPNLRRDGGDCELVEVCGNKIMVKLTGACVLCKLSSATLEGIQARIIEKLGEFVRLVPVPAGGPSRPIPVVGVAPSRH
jgi:Fe-S cluster biogenesis protein NfuA